MKRKEPLRCFCGSAEHTEEDHIARVREGIAKETPEQLFERKRRIRRAKGFI